jgi:tetratricopeptide (TPR) repeat protein
MEDAVAWSYRLLTPPAAHVLDRLSVFTGGAATEAVATVCDDPELGGTGELADHNLVVVEAGAAGERRVRLLQIVRAFAAARLRDRGEEGEARDSHLGHVAELARTGRLGLAGEDQPRWLLRLDAEVGNLATACSWACRNDRADRAADVVGDLWWFWWASGRWIEARTLIDLLRAHRPALDHARRARVDFAEAHLAFLTGDLGRARRVAATLALASEAPLEAAYACCFLVALDGASLGAVEEPLERIRRAPDGAQHLGTLLSGCALVALARGRLDEAARWIREAITVYAGLGQPYGLGVTENLAGDLARRQDDLDGAALHYASAIAALRRALVRPDLPAALANLGDVRLARGDVEEARTLLVEALVLQWRLGNRLGQARCLRSLAGAEARDGDPFDAAVLLGAADACFEGDHPMSTPTTVGVGGLLADLRARLGEQELAAATAQGHDDVATAIRRLAST